MAISKALEFVDLAIVDDKLRELCNSGLSKKALLDILEFNQIEFEDAINMNLVKCQTFDEAERFQQLKMWFEIL